MLVVQVAEPEGGDVKAPKSGRARRVPVADRVLPLVRAMATGKADDDRLFVFRIRPSAARKRIEAHDALGLGGRWPADPRSATHGCVSRAGEGVDPVTVQAWMGHASIATTNLYLHHLGTSADLAGLGRLNAAGHTGGTHPAAAVVTRESKSDESA